MTQSDFPFSRRKTAARIDGSGLRCIKTYRQLRNLTRLMAHWNPGEAAKCSGVSELIAKNLSINNRSHLA
jgi:hypothetical protein